MTALLYNANPGISRPNRNLYQPLSMRDGPGTFERTRPGTIALRPWTMALSDQDP